MPHTFDLRLATLRTAYREGRTTPRQLIAELRAKAAALNPDYHLFIHLLTPDDASERVIQIGSHPGASVEDS